MEQNRMEIQRYISLCVGILGLVFCGILHGFNIYAVALKQTFNYTQTELEYITVSGIAGSGITSYFNGVVIDKYGPRSACVIAAILSSSCFALEWMSTKFISFFTSRSWLICLIYFVGSAGCCFTYMASMSTIALNFEGKHQGKVVGFASAMFGGSPLIFALIYQVFFVQGHVTDEQNQNLGGFFIMLSIWAGCTGVLGAGFLKIVPPVETHIPLMSEGEHSKQNVDETNVTTNETAIDHDTEKGKCVTASDDNITNAKDNTLNDKTPLFQKESENSSLTTCSDEEKNMTCFRMVKTFKFHLLLWVVIIIKGIGLILSANITTIAKSAHLEATSSALILIIPVADTLARSLGGIIPDFLKQRLPFISVSSVLVFASFLMMVAQMILIFFNQSFVALVCFSIMSSVSTGFIAVMTPITISEFFGMKEFSQKLGLLLTLNGLAAFLFAKVFGWIYENNSPRGSKDCFGEHCSRMTFIIMAIFALLSTLFSSALLKTRWECYKNPKLN
ncbi:unnamed protein product [Owenia fusiformis]|uniref:Uncharacterized protein n=1 Tax=Owenia fusiformis TaxID=6347 RepID=A0A8J1TM22_OWEFU|nr:unnamed protein product [Owenia fusiformis]